MVAKPPRASGCQSLTPAMSGGTGATRERYLRRALFVSALGGYTDALAPRGPPGSRLASESGWQDVFRPPVRDGAQGCEVDSLQGQEFAAYARRSKPFTACTGREQPIVSQCKTFALTEGSGHNALVGLRPRRRFRGFARRAHVEHVLNQDPHGRLVFLKLRTASRLLHCLGQSGRAVKSG
jgi:hypothetical protein